MTGRPMEQPGRCLDPDDPNTSDTNPARRDRICIAVDREGDHRDQMQSDGAIQVAQG
jgi:hypothetical protein